MIKHKEVIQAWLDGKVIECKTSHGWLEWGGNEYAYSPITDIDMSWRIKPVTKQVDYQALIDAKMLVAFTDADGYYSSHSHISRLAQIDYDNLYIDDFGASWEVIVFEEGLKQVISPSTSKKLVSAGFYVEVESAYRCPKMKDDLYIVVLTGIMEGYTL